MIVERVLYNGDIITLDDQRPRASALAINQGRVIVVGTDDEIKSLARSKTTQENLNKSVVVPGMTDAHIHWQGVAQALHTVDLFDVPSKNEALERVAARTGQTPSGQWIEGYGWTQDAWADRQFPSAHDLDLITPDHPVFLRARSGHAAWVNTLALRLCGIDAHTHSPEGGEIIHDQAGQPTGILLESPAMNLVAERIPPLTVDQIADQMQRAQTVALSLGMTGFHDFDDQECFSALQRLRERGELRLRVVKNINKPYFDSMIQMGIRWGFGDDWIRIGGLKLFADGALGPRTAYMIEPYDGEPDNYGIVVTDKEEMAELVSRASAAGLHSTVHAIGDRAVHYVLDVYATVRREEAARGEPSSTRRHRIEHVQLIHPDDVQRLAELDLIASMQPIHATSDFERADLYWGSRTPYSYNPRLQLERGAVVAFGSDAPYDMMGPLKGIHAAVTRQRADGSPGTEGWNPSARLTVDEALRGFTFAPAFAAGMEDRLGKLMPGHLADLVVLDRDLYAVPPSELLDVRVLATMVGGVWQYGGL